MPLEDADYICDLVPTNPLGSDNVSQGDDHLRLLRKVLLQSFPAICGPVTVDQDTLNNAGKSLMPIVTTYTTVGAGTHTFTAGRTWCRVIVTGGGGGGYAANAGLGGFGGGTAIKTMAINGASATYFVGGGGTVGSDTSGSSNFVHDGNSVIGTKGPQGVVSQDSGVSGGLPTGGDINIRGGGPEGQSAGAGGASYWSGGNSTDAGGGLNNNACFGTGGRGGSSTQGGRNGISGVVYIEEY